MNKPTHGGQIQRESIWISLGWRRGGTWGEMNAEGLYCSEVAIWAGGSFTLAPNKIETGFRYSLSYSVTDLRILENHAS